MLLRLSVRSSVRKAQQCLPRCYPRFSSLYNPMFPERPIKDDIDASEQSKKKSDAPADDFFSRHGGKIAAGSLSVIAYFVYSFYMGGELRAREEELLIKESSLEPYEINELRDTNHMSVEEYESLVNVCFSAFPLKIASYEEFIAVVNRARFPKVLMSAHLFDRLIYSHIIVNHKQREEQWETTKLPVSFLLTALHMTVKAPPDVRIDNLFQLALLLSPSSQSPDLDRFDEVGDDWTPAPASCDVSAAAEVIENLGYSWQMPVAKRVIETGVRYPWKTYRRKCPADSIQLYLESLKPPQPSAEVLTKEQFRELILGSSACAWGECYRHR